jgi:[acyl-carrier-protein] S-malonyltransferase
LKVAYLFPGQGSQKAGMGKDLAEAFPSARAVFDEVDEALASPLSRLCFEGPDEDLRLTENTQPAILAVSAAAWEALNALGRPAEPAYLAGHSLGEYSANVAAGSFPCGEAARLVRRRGAYMQEAVPVGEGAMAAVMGLDAPGLEALCEVAGGEAWVSVDNGPGQQVIAGRKGAVERAGELAKERGAKRVVFLEVSAPFHTPLMGPARQRLEKDLENLAIADPRRPVVANVDAAPRQTGEAVRRALAMQVTDRVQWARTLEFLLGEGVDTLVELGPGRVLSGLARTVSRDWRVLNVEDQAGAEEAARVLSGQGG